MGNPAGSNTTKLVVVGVLSVLGALVGLILIANIYEENLSGYAQVKQAFPSGHMTVIADPGYFGQWFGTLSEYKEAGTYVFSDVAESKGDGSESLSGNSIDVRFSDGGTAKISGSARFTIPTGEPSLLEIHSQFRSYNSLIRNLFKPAVREAVVLSAALMTSEQSYSGGKSELSQFALDQLQNGAYKTDSDEVRTENKATGQVNIERIVTIRRDPETGFPLRKENILESYGVRVTQLFFPDDFAYEAKILEQIGKVRDAQMAATSAFARADTAAQNEKTAAAEGRAAVAQAKAEANVSKQKAVTAAEQAKEVAVLAAQSRAAVAKENEKAAAAQKRADILRGQGEAEAKKLLMAADGALSQKLAAFVKTQEVWAAAFAKRQVPQQVFGGGGGAGTDSDVSSLMKLLTVRAAKDLTLDLRTK